MTFYHLPYPALVLQQELHPLHVLLVNGQQERVAGLQEQMLPPDL